MCAGQHTAALTALASVGVFAEKTPAERHHDAWRAAAMSVCRGHAAGLVACRQGFVLTHPQARRADLASREVRRLVRNGEWTAPRRGVLWVLSRPDGVRRVHGESPEIIAAAAALIRPDSVISHASAASAHGLDVLTMPRRATQSTNSRAHAVADAATVVHAASLPDDEVGRWITNCARTVVDIARSGIRGGLVVADSALRNELVTMDELRAAVNRQRGWRGVTAARRVLDLASPFSESPLESVTRLFLDDHGVPLPEQQRWINTHRGWYRVDGLWERETVVLEADGLQKYRERLEALPDEKLREEALRRAGYDVVRVMWRDLFREPEQTVARIRNALREVVTACSSE